MARARACARVPRVGVALVLLACAPGCRTPPVVGSDTERPASSGIDAGELDLPALADAIDPGPRRPLSAEVPAFLLDAIGLSGALPREPEELVARANAELEAWQEIGAFGDLGRTLEVVKGLARGVVLAERAVELGSRDPRTLAVLERLYDALDTPIIANDRALFPQMMQRFVQASAADGHIKDSAAVEGLSNLVFGTLQRAGPAHRHAVAELVRTSDDPAAVADALERVARKIRRDDSALGVRAMRASIALRGEAVQPRHLVALADVCHAALEPECGADALARARAGATALDEEAKDALDASLKKADTKAKDARTAIALRDAETLADRLKQARALLDLERHADAEAAYKRLRADFPHEAGPVVGLARHAVVSDFDLVGASAIIEQAGPVEHADVPYYEIAIGTRATALIYDIIPRAVAGRSFDEAYASLEPTLTSLRERIVAYEGLGADKGTVLRFLVDIAMDEVVPITKKGGLDGAIPLLRGLLPRVVALARRVPESPHAFLLVAGAAQFAGDAKAAFAALEAPLPPDPHGKLQMRRAISRYELVVTWDDPAGLDALLRDVADLRARFDTAPVQALAGDTHALAARVRGDEAAWALAEAAYRAALGDVATSKNARVLNNLAVAVAEQGRTAEAIELWAQAIAAGIEHTSMPRINLAATRNDKEDRATLLEQEEAGDMVDARLLARAWRAEHAPARERARLLDALKAEVAEQAPRHLRPRLLPGAAGVALQGTLNFGLGYSTNDGLQLDVSTASEPWLAMRPPGLPFDPRFKKPRPR